MRVISVVIPQFISLASIVLKDKGIMSCNCSRTTTMRAASAAFVRSGFGRQLPASAAAEAARRSGSSGCGGATRVRPWQRMFCTSNDQQQTQQRTQQHLQQRQEQPSQERNGELNGGTPSTSTSQQQEQQEGLGNLPSPTSAVKLDTAAQLELDRSIPLRHSNPDIQVLLDRYTRLCDNEDKVPSVSPVFGKADRRSPSRAVFSNTNVDLSRVEVVGFDYDYTLATCESI